MEDKYRPLDVTRRSLTSGARVLRLAWAFATLFALYGAEDVHEWLAPDEEAGAVERAIAGGLLHAGRATGIVSLHRAIDARVGLPGKPPLFLRRSVALPAPRAAIAFEPDSPRRILLVGASSIEHVFGTELERCLEGFTGVEVHRAGRLGTGLGRPGVFDWRAEIAQLQTDFPADLVLGQFAGNDCQAARDPHTGRTWAFGTPEWEEEYRRRVARIAKDVLGRRTQMGFLGQLAVRKESADECFDRLDRVTRKGAEESGAWFLPLRDLTRGSDGRVLETIAGPRGTRARIWGFDDLHLNRDGSRFVTEQICAQLERRLSLDGGDPAKGRVLRFETPSNARGRTVPWYAVLPRQIPADGVPALYLLHGGGGSAEDWMQAQDALQRLAVMHGIAIVVPDGDEYGWYVDGLPPNSGIESFLLRELIPDVERRLPVSGRRGIAGLSMGGHGALVLALRNSGTFASASSMSGVVDLTWDPGRPGLARVLGGIAEHRERWEERSARQLLQRRPDAFRGLALKLSCGEGDRFLEINRAFHRALEEKKVPHLYDESPGAHDWAYWTHQLPAHVAWHAGELRRSRSDQER